MRLQWEERYRYRPPSNLETKYWSLTRDVGAVHGVNTGYIVLFSKPHGKFAAALPNGDFKLFDSEDEAKNYCEVCCRMEVHHGKKDW